MGVRMLKVEVWAIRTWRSCDVGKRAGSGGVGVLSTL